jgi:hypothetical protein
LPIASAGVRDDEGNFFEMTTFACGTELLPGQSCTFGVTKVSVLNGLRYSPKI